MELISPYQAQRKLSPPTLVSHAPISSPTVMHQGDPVRRARDAYQDPTNSSWS
jgi:hypothetical protein